MSRIRLLLLSMFAVMAVSAIASASASANEVCEGTTVIVLCLELPAGSGTLVELEGEASFTSKIESGVESLLETEGLAHIVCTSASNTGTFLSPAKLEAPGLTVDNVVITFTGCTILEPVGANCEIKEGTIKTASISGEALEPTTGNYEFDFKPTTGEVFAEITIKSKAGKTCLIAKTAKVTGTQSCKLVNPIEENALVHLIECVESGSSLLFAEKTSTFKLTEEVELSGTNKGEKYDIRLS